MSAPSTSGLSVELLLRVIDVKHGYFTLLYFFMPSSQVFDLCDHCKLYTLMTINFVLYAVA